MSALSSQVTTRHQQTDVHESITKQDRININDPQKKHCLGTVSKNISLEGLNQFNGAPTSPLVQMWFKLMDFIGNLNFECQISLPAIALNYMNMAIHEYTDAINRAYSPRRARNKKHTHTQKNLT